MNRDTPNADSTELNENTTGAGTSAEGKYQSPDAVTDEARNDGDAALNETDARNGFENAGDNTVDPNYKSADHPAA